MIISDWVCPEKQVCHRFVGGEIEMLMIVPKNVIPNPEEHLPKGYDVDYSRILTGHYYGSFVKITPWWAFWRKTEYYYSFSIPFKRAEKK